MPLEAIVKVGRPNEILNRFGRPTLTITASSSGIGEGRDPGGMKARIHVVTTVWHFRGGGVKVVVYRGVFETPSRLPSSCADGLNLS